MISERTARNKHLLRRRTESPQRRPCLTVELARKYLHVKTLSGSATRCTPAFATTGRACVTTHRGPIEEFDIRQYPDHRTGAPPDVYRLRDYGYLDEYEAIWGRPWGAQGIGKLREVGLVAPTTHEVNPLWQQDPDFFLLRYQSQIDVELLISNHKEWAAF